MKFEFDYECDKDWDEMKGGDRRRFCDSCDKHVHHISGMTEKQAKEFLERHNYEVCVDFYRDDEGHTKFSERERMLDRQGDGLKQLVASALAIVPLALGAAFIDFDSADAPAPVLSVASPAPVPQPPPINLGGPNPVIVQPNVTPDPHPPVPQTVPDITPDPIIPDITPDPIIKPVVDTPDIEPQPMIRPPRPHVRGKIARPADWNL